MCLCTGLLVACAGAQASVSRTAGAIPAGPTAAGVRRPASVPTCTGSGLESFIGGGGGNVAAGGVAGILGGLDNEVCDNQSSVVGGFGNIISSGGDTANDAFVGGGSSNTIGATTTGSSIVGGKQNSIANAPFSFVGGGDGNSLTGEYGLIGGGLDNVMSAEYGVIAGGLGGYANSAAGIYSFAAGVRASAVQNGTFVWSDGSNGDATLASTAPYQFLARAAGGYTFWTNAAATVGATLAPGSGTWASASDRSLKIDVARVNDAAVLDKVSRLPIERWSYKSERGVRHVGPMAQDFYAAFGVGPDDKHITSIDEDGVALAAIKGLHAENASLRALASSQAAEIAGLKTSQARHDLLVQRQLRRLSAAVAALGERNR